MHMFSKCMMHISFCIFLFFSYGCAGTKVTPPKLIAHAAGAVEGKTYTNSLEALNANYDKGHRFFEIDFSWTTDSELVAIHDWQYILQTQFIVPSDVIIPSKTQYQKLISRLGLTQMCAEDVLNWVQQRDNTFIVTDVKENNAAALALLVFNAKDLEKIIPQVYSFKEYDEISKLGFKNIILTLYRMKVVPAEVISFASEKRPFAITMPLGLARSNLASTLKERGVIVYTHTVNDIQIYNSLITNGVYGVYTDSLSF